MLGICPGALKLAAVYHIYTMSSGDVRYLAKYPFLRDTREYVGSIGLSFDDMLRHPVYSAMLEMGRRRVLECSEGKFRPQTDEDLKAQLTVLSYPVARMIAHSLGRAAAAKYAEGEADAAYEMLREEPDQVVADISRDLGLQIRDGSMPLLQYVRLAAALTRANPKWKLVNRPVHSGQVEADMEDARRLLREAIRNRVLEPVDLKRIPDEVKKVALAVRMDLAGGKPTVEIESLEDAAMPPCMKAMISAMEAGVASHNAMFILATFLANLGLKKADILKVYSKSPKYDEEKTLYQLEFLMGEKGATEYTCPACATIKSHGLCKADCDVKHPLQYYRRHARKKPKVIKKEKK
jgi:DNA primase large subunit